MNFKLIDYQGKGFVVMSAHDFTRWQDNLERRFDDSVEAGNAHLQVRVGGQTRSYPSVESYLQEFTVRDINEEEAHLLSKIFAVDQELHPAWYGEHDIFQPLAGK